MRLLVLLDFVVALVYHKCDKHIYRLNVSCRKWTVLFNARFFSGIIQKIFRYLLNSNDVFSFTVSSHFCLSFSQSLIH